MFREDRLTCIVLMQRLVIVNIINKERIENKNKNKAITYFLINNSLT